MQTRGSQKRERERFCNRDLQQQEFLFSCSSCHAFQRALPAAGSCSSSYAVAHFAGEAKQASTIPKQSKAEIAGPKVEGEKKGRTVNWKEKMELRVAPLPPPPLLLVQSHEDRES